MITDEDIEYAKFCAKNEAERAYETLDALLSTLCLLNFHNSDRYRTLSEAKTELSIICMFGIEVFEENDDRSG